MIVVRALFIILICGSAYAQEGSLLKPCDTQDIDCLSHTTEQFLEKTCKGIPEYDIKPIDPMIIPSLDYTAYEEKGVILRFRDLNITGLRNQKISNFKMDTAEKSVVLTTQVTLNIFGHITIELSKISQNFSGIYAAKTNTLGTALYNYKLRTDDKGVEYFEVGPETISCQLASEPEVQETPITGLHTNTDPEIKEILEKIESEKSKFRTKYLCEIVKEAYHTVVHNIRATAKILPKSAFFKNI